MAARLLLMGKHLTPNHKDRVLWKIGGTFPDSTRNSPGLAFGNPTDTLAEHYYTL